MTSVCPKGWYHFCPLQPAVEAPWKTMENHPTIINHPFVPNATLVWLSESCLHFGRPRHLSDAPQAWPLAFGVFQPDRGLHRLSWPSTSRSPKTNCRPWHLLHVQADFAICQQTVENGTTCFDWLKAFDIFYSQPMSTDATSDGQQYRYSFEHRSFNPAVIFELVRVYLTFLVKEMCTSPSDHWQWFSHLQ